MKGILFIVLLLIVESNKIYCQINCLREILINNYTRSNIVNLGNSTYLTNDRKFVQISVHENQPMLVDLDLCLSKLNLTSFKDYSEDLDKLLVEFFNLTRIDWEYDLIHGCEYINSFETKKVMKKLISFYISKSRLTEYTTIEEYTLLKDMNLKHACEYPKYLSKFNLDSLNKFFNLNNSEFLKMSFVKHFISLHYDFSDLIISNINIYKAFFIKDIKNLRLIRYDNNCQYTSTKDCLYSPLITQVREHLIEISDTSFCSVFENNSLELLNERVGVHRYLSMCGSDKIPQILQKLFINSYPCIINDCKSEVFIALSAFQPGRDKCLEFLIDYFNNTKASKLKKLELLGYFQKIPSRKAFDFLENYYKLEKDKEVKERIEIVRRKVELKCIHFELNEK